MSVAMDFSTQKSPSIVDGLFDYITVELLGCAMPRTKAPAARVPLPPRPADAEDGAELYDTYAHAER